jgi:predicted flap endonuclease-1-like 5' DNA nuclease
MRSLNKFVITMILLYLIWRWLNQPPETRPAPYPERRKQPYFPAESQAQVIASTRQDDLTEINGIGLKASQALQQGGVHTFAQLASLDAEHIKAILKAYGLRNLDPTTWPEQAAVAARTL